ncbi:MAG: hypothetical protein ACK6DZ_06085 [Acidobacteriota bacterium]
MKLDYIQPGTLVEWVENTAPFLFREAAGSLGGRLIEAGDFVEILRRVKAGYEWPEGDGESVEDYFALCLAAHHGTVATFIPTDVDSKIRGLLWREARERGVRRRMFEFAVEAMGWPLEGVSRRYTEVAGRGPVSGHNGEQLSGLMGAMEACLRDGDEEYAERAWGEVERELEREAVEFETAIAGKGRELDALRIASSVTHNVGDVDQGLSYWSKNAIYEPARGAFGRLAHENTKPFRGVFARAAKVYKKVMSAEGHRHYPLRGIKGLRQHAELLLPLGPFLDEWGGRVARHGGLSEEDKAEVLGALVTGCRKIAGQKGYYRAIRGFEDALGASGVGALLKKQPNSVRKDYENAELRKLVAVSRESFESSMRKGLAAALV